MNSGTDSMTSNLVNLSLSIEGMTCAACMLHVETALIEVEGVNSASVNLATEKASISLSPESNTELLAQALKEAGYGARVEKQTIVLDKIPENQDSLVEEYLSIKGVRWASIDDNKISIESYSMAVERTDLRKIATENDLQILDFEEEFDPHALAKEAESSALRRRFIVALSGGLLVMMLNMGILENTPLKLSQNLNVLLQLIITTPIQFWAGAPFYKGAITAARHKTSNMNTLVALGTFSAYLFSIVSVLAPGIIKQAQEETIVYFDTGIIIIALVLLGRFLEAQAKGKAANAINSLLRLQPKTATIKRDGEQVKVPIETITPGSILIVKPGETIPIDGKIISGASNVNESMLTGESNPVSKGINDEIVGGTINLNGTFEFIATKVGGDTVLSQIIRIVERAQESKPPIQKVADKVASYFVPIVIGISLLTFFIWFNWGPDPTISYAISNMITVLIIACPCALGLAAPTATMASTGTGAKFGILIKGFEQLEKARKADIVIFDKTGTLTNGSPSITQIKPLTGWSKQEIVSFATTLEQYSTHPLSEAINTYAKQNKIKTHPSIKDFEEITGQGLKAYVNDELILVGNRRLMDDNSVEIESTYNITSDMFSTGKTVIYIGISGSIAGLIAIEDSIKPTAQKALERLEQMKIPTLILTGDEKQTADSLAKELGITDVKANLTPEGKLNEITNLQSQGKTVVMVGDGINDAPALTQADVGIALGSGTDIAIESAGITLISDDLNGVANSLLLAKNTVHTIWGNFFWAFIYNIILIPVAAGVMYFLFKSNGVPDNLHFFFGTQGFLNPTLAALAMAFSSVSVVMNSLRLTRFKPRS